VEQAAHNVEIKPKHFYFWRNIILDYCDISRQVIIQKQGQTKQMIAREHPF
jgi:hypothetical protein